MGLRRWMRLVLLILLLIVGVFEILTLVEGPYDVACSNRPGYGFNLRITSIQSGSSITLPSPWGGCPG